MNASTERQPDRTGPAQRAVFLDRDGTLNVNPPSGDFVRRAEDLELLPDAASALKLLTNAGYMLVIYTNQSGIAKGYMTQDDVDAVNAKLSKRLDEQGVHLSGIYLCPHRNEDNCECRKPKPGLLNRAASELDIDISRSWAIGDSARDVQAAQAAGCRTIMVYGNAYPGQREKAEALGPVASVATLSEAAQIIINAQN